ncbi:molybdenum cofactor biosynthesis protein MoaE [Pseudemcibacter aquimaris]|uniref:molybdenum cofactor biosynthesis protein MoaE n=1 Tax=Pseudemcibacter aquimaris TaxID=2857064 RepID=UPI0020114B1A|nr:molybdenum cofactor biosynthesis protein MoaE [Pseudemcibacter aquimaris]MCC3859724.1 molybdenum cofactor biosynthesis protein MoaE [Pseudemcibacter aquimaris]WDU60119.1 molybdenum cofactor biosynthesis protein MoaE [Pseudemcibacter aquimaris]
MRVSVQSEDFNIANEIALLSENRTDLGAIASFTGLVRDIHGDKSIKSMTLEHFPGMAEQELEKIGHEAEKRWPIQGLTIIHRYGKLLPGDQIVLVIATSHHREAAFNAAQFIMDWLKTDAPFWKKEETDEGTHWVAAKSDDDDKKARWE